MFHWDLTAPPQHHGKKISFISTPWTSSRTCVNDWYLTLVVPKPGKCARKYHDTIHRLQKVAAN